MLSVLFKVIELVLGAIIHDTVVLYVTELSPVRCVIETHIIMSLTSNFFVLMTSYECKGAHKFLPNNFHGTRFHSIIGLYTVWANCD